MSVRTLPKEPGRRIVGGSRAPFNHSSSARFTTLATSLGEFALIQHADGTLSSEWLHLPTRPPPARRDVSMLPQVMALLERYFAGEADVDFNGVETPPGPPFFRRCWEACRRIPPGETWSYERLAREAGSESSAARAAGQAMRRNRLPVIVPCHRVVARDGSLHGFAGSRNAKGPELALKSGLLQLERGSGGRRGPNPGGISLETSP